MRSDASGKKNALAKRAAAKEKLRKGGNKVQAVRAVRGAHKSAKNVFQDAEPELGVHGVDMSDKPPSSGSPSSGSSSSSGSSQEARNRGNIDWQEKIQRGILRRLRYSFETP